MTTRRDPPYGTLGLVLMLGAMPACFNPPSDALETGVDTVAPTTTSATTDPESTGEVETTAAPTTSPSDETTVAVDGSSSESGPGTTQGPAECGDGLVGGDEACDDAGESATCDGDCTAVECGDGTANVAAGEACDEGGESVTCDADCTAVECGDGAANVTVGEECDDAGETAACDVDCTPAECGDFTINATAGEACDDGNGIPGDGCNQCLLSMACSGGATLLAQSPGGDMVVCDDPTDTVCEQNTETLCPAGWGLCTREQHVNRNNGFDYPLSYPAVGEIHCRTGSGAGHYTLYDNINQDPVLGCEFGSSRPSCETMYGCNEQGVSALCCAPTPSCGNGIVDAPEETCDDANASEVDECLSSCSWRLPGNHGFPNCS